MGIAVTLTQFLEDRRRYEEAVSNDAKVEDGLLGVSRCPDVRENLQATAWFCMIHFKINLTWDGCKYNAIVFSGEEEMLITGEDPIEVLFAAVKCKNPQACPILDPYRKNKNID